jgi:hypothetical protein
LIARDRAVLEIAAADITQATKRRVKGFVADTSDDAAMKTGVAQVLSEFDRIDISSIAPPPWAAKANRRRSRKSPTKPFSPT